MDIAMGYLNSLRNWFWKWSWPLTSDLVLSMSGILWEPCVRLPYLTLIGREENEWQNSSWGKTRCPWEQLEGEPFPKEITDVYPCWERACSRKEGWGSAMGTHPWRESSTGTPADCLSFSSQFGLDIDDAASWCCCLIFYLEGPLERTSLVLPRIL